MIIEPASIVLSIIDSNEIMLHMIRTIEKLMIIINIAAKALKKPETYIQICQIQ
jgi:hypothetical protein